MEGAIFQQKMICFRCVNLHTDSLFIPMTIYYVDSGKSVRSYTIFTTAGYVYACFLLLLNTEYSLFLSLSLLPPENGFHEGPWSWQQLSYHLTDRQGWGWGWTGTRHWCRVCGCGWVATERLTETSKRNVSTFIKGGNNMLEKKWTEGERRRLRQNRPSLRMMWVECSCSFWHV